MTAAALSVMVMKSESASLARFGIHASLRAEDNLVCNRSRDEVGRGATAPLLPAFSFAACSRAQPASTAARNPATATNSPAPMVKKSDENIGSCRPESNATNATVPKVRARTQESLGDLGNAFDAFGPDKQEPFYRTPAHSTWPQHPRKGGPRCDGPSGQRGNCGRVTRRSTADHNPQRARCEEVRAGANRIAEKGSGGVGREGAL